MSADAFSVFEEVDRELSNISALREVGRDGAHHPHDVCQDFRGRPPSSHALFESYMTQNVTHSSWCFGGKESSLVWNEALIASDWIEDENFLGGESPQALPKSRVKDLYSINFIHFNWMKGKDTRGYPHFEYPPTARCYFTEKTWQTTTSGTPCPTVCH